MPTTMKFLIIASFVMSYSVASAQSYCYSHSDCSSSTPFCYHWYSSTGYCTSCNYCYHCSDGIDGTCGAECGTTAWGYVCDDTTTTPSPSGSGSACYSHSDCGSSAPFCYEYSSYYGYGYCSDCDTSTFCSYGIDGTCGDECGQETYYGASCDGSSNSIDWGYDDGYPTAEECDWVKTNANSDGQTLLSSDSTMDECIETAWTWGCDIANWHNATSGETACYCQYGDDQTVEEGSEYRSCFLDEYRDGTLAWLA